MAEPSAGAVATVPDSAPARNGAGNTDQSSFAQFVDSTDLEALGRLVVTEGMRGESPDHLTRRIEVLHAQDLDRLPEAERNLADLLRSTSGQYVNVLSRNDVNWGSAGGLGVQYSTWLLDGLPMDALADGMVIDADAIDRVEVLQGPAAVLYPDYLSQDFLGTESPLAVTANFVLKHRIERPLAWLSAGAGSYDTRRLGVYAQGPGAHDLSYVLGGDSEHSAYTQAGDPGSFLQSVQPPRYRKDKLFVSLDYAPAGSGTLLTAFYQSTTHAGNLGRPQRAFDHHYETLNLGWQQALGSNWDAQLRVGERRYDRLFENDAWPVSLAQVNLEQTHQRVLPYGFSVSWRHGGSDLLTAGVDGQQVDYDTRISLPGAAAAGQDLAQAQGQGVFAHEKLQLGRWVLRAGLRHDRIHQDYRLLGGSVPALPSADWQRTLWTLGARLAVAPALALYANLGSSFAPPTAKQVGGTVAQPDVSGQLPNRTLRPESGLGRDVGMSWQVAAGAALGVRAFVNSVHAAIVTEVVSQLPSQVIAENAGSVEARGLELNWREDLADGTAWFANLTSTHSRVSRDGVQAPPPAATPFAPDQVANAGIDTNVAGVADLSLLFQWVGRYYDGSDPRLRRAFGRHGTCGLRARREFPAGASLRARLTLDVDNLTGRQYDKPFGFRDPGFNALLTLALLYP